MVKSLWMGLLTAFCLFVSGCGAADHPTPNGQMEATVKRVVDGDTFETAAGEKVRMIGVDTPETVKPNHPVEHYGKEASAYTKQLLTGKEVLLRFDIETRDKYGRLLAYVYLPDGTFVNQQLIREGYGRVLTIPPNVKHADLFLQAEREARERNRGLWGKGEPAPSNKRIKGNVNSKGEKIYHLPGTRDYERTKAEVWFATEEEAKVAGFRPPRR
jgi:micrococcal nuclease